MPTAHVNGTELYYEDTGGSREAVVFLHGVLWNGALFDAQVTALRPHYRCITFDHRGQGRSAVTPFAHDIDSLTADAAALIEALATGPCHLVAHSMGGFVALRLALRRPELVRSLALLSTSAEAEPLWNRLRLYLLSLAAGTLGLRPFLGPLTAGFFGRKFRRDPANGAELRRRQHQLLATDFRGFRAAVRAINGREAIDREIGAIRVPTLILVGVEDGATTPARARHMQERIPGARLLVLSDVGHTPTVEAPAAVNAALLEHLGAPALRTPALWRGGRLTPSAARP